jgi:TPR repeat protein
MDASTSLVTATSSRKVASSAIERNTHCDEGFQLLRAQKFKEAFACFYKAATEDKHLESIYVLFLFYSPVNDFLFACEDTKIRSKMKVMPFSANIEKEIFNFYQQRNGNFAKLCLAICYHKGYGELNSTKENELFRFLSERANDLFAIHVYSVLALNTSRTISSEPYRTNYYLIAYANAQIGAFQGYPPSEYVLGLILSENKGVEKDEKRAYEYLEKAAKKGFAQAEYLCGIFNQYGLGGLAVNNVAAMEWYTKAMGQNLSKAPWRLSKFYGEGIGIPKEPTIARQLLLNAANEECSDAAFELGQAYLAEGRKTEGMLRLVEAASQDHPAALLFIGDEKKKEGDWSRSYSFYEKAAKLGNISAWVKLGSWYEEVPDSRRSFEEAEKHYRKAIALGDNNARICLGTFLIDRDRPEEGISCLLEGGALQEKQGLAQLIEIYLNGRKAIKADFTKALSYMQKLAGMLNARGPIALDQKIKACTEKIAEYEKNLKAASKACSTLETKALEILAANSSQSLLPTQKSVPVEGLDRDEKREIEQLRLASFEELTREVDKVSKNAISMINGYIEKLKALQTQREQIASQRLINHETIKELSDIARKVNVISGLLDEADKRRTVSDMDKARQKELKGKISEVKKTYAEKREKMKQIAAMSAEIALKMEGIRLQAAKNKERLEALPARLDRIVDRFETETTKLLDEFSRDPSQWDAYLKQLNIYADHARQNLSDLFKFSPSQPLPESQDDLRARISELERQKHQAEREAKVTIHELDRQVVQEKERREEELRAAQEAGQAEMRKLQETFDRQKRELEELKKHLRENSLTGNIVVLVQEAKEKLEALLIMNNNDDRCRRILDKLGRDDEEGNVSILREIGFTGEGMGRTAGSHQKYTHPTLGVISFSDHGENPTVKEVIKMKVLKALNTYLEQLLLKS